MAGGCRRSSTGRLGCAVVALTADITAWMQILAFSGSTARRWEPKRLRLRLFTIPAALVRHGRRTWLKLKHTHPWATVAQHAITALHRATTAQATTAQATAPG